MKPLIINAEYMYPDSELPLVKEPCEIHFTRFGKNKRPGENVEFFSDAKTKIFVNCNEPTTSAWVEQADHIIANQEKYTAIMTSNPKVLQNCKNSYLLPYGTTWLNKYTHHIDSLGRFTDDLGLLEKQNSISMICGASVGKRGYDIRQKIWYYKDKIPCVKKFYTSTRFPLPNEQQLPNDDKINLFYSMYSVAIESSGELNYFTEKLIDCLITKTIPIYWGCPNISDFFDTSYWINPQQIFTSEYSENYYQENLQKINDNFERAKYYASSLFNRVIEKANLI